MKTDLFRHGLTDCWQLLLQRTNHIDTSSVVEDGVANKNRSRH